jgi:hypothetical protein
LKRCECREEINGFEYRGLALRVITGKQNNPFGKFHIQTGKLAEIGEGVVFEIHYFVGARSSRPIS